MLNFRLLLKYNAVLVTVMLKIQYLSLSAPLLAFECRSTSLSGSLPPPLVSDRPTPQVNQHLPFIRFEL